LLRYTPSNTAVVATAVSRPVATAPVQTLLFIGTVSIQTTT
jgi:hypothetical protein